jgi:hypothetical protein
MPVPNYLVIRQVNARNYKKQSLTYKNSFPKLSKLMSYCQKASYFSRTQTPAFKLDHKFTKIIQHL